MLSKRSPQRGMFEADNLYMDYVGRDTFYGFLASQRGKLFLDEDFAELYCPDNGRASVPPSKLSIALLLQAHDRVSDQEAKARADFDLRWKVAMGIKVDERPFAKSTLQLFRAQLILHEKMRAVFLRSLEYARQTGYLKRRRKMKVALDTTNILGRGAVKDTYNLLADGIKKLIGGLAQLEGTEIKAWAERHGFSRYFGSSIKGEAEIEWGNEQERQRFLKGIVADADRLLGIARERLGATPEGSEQEERIVEEAALLARLLCQDVQRDGDEVALKEGVARDRVVSVHDPEMRHGRKSASKRFSGHKAAIAVDTDTQLITAVAVLPGNAPDAEKALELTRESESNTGAEVEAALGDCAYGDGATREEFENAGYKLRAKLPKRGKKDQLPKEAFRIDLEASSCTCPSGQTTHTLVSAGIRKDRKGRQHQLKRFCFDSAICTACPLRSSCVKACGNKGRTIALHPHERLLQEARAFQESEAFSEYLQRRQAVEHRLARLVQLGIRQARYFGRAKTVFQLLMAATVANLTLVATKTGQMRSRRGQKSTSSSFLSQIWATAKAFWNHLIRYPVDPNLLSRYASPLHTGFRPHF